MSLTTAWVRIPAWACEKVASDLGLDVSRPGHVKKLPVTWGWTVVFSEYSGFLHYLHLANHELAIIGINVTINEIPKSVFTNCPSYYFLYALLNPSNTEATFVQITRTQRFLKIILALSCWNAFGSSAEFSQISTHMRGFQSVCRVFSIILYWPN